MTSSEPDFATEFETTPPTPIEATGQIPNSCLDSDSIPEHLFPAEHTAKIEDMKVLRSGWECPQCGSNIFLHPESIVPHNALHCFRCSYAPLTLAWWENARLTDINPES